MATVMTWGNSEGTQGRCDARCHNAVEWKCRCMCRGRYHGRASMKGGMDQAIREYGEEILEGAKKRAAKEGFEIKAKDIGELLELFAKTKGDQHGH